MWTFMSIVCVHKKISAVLWVVPDQFCSSFHEFECSIINKNQPSYASKYKSCKMQTGKLKYTFADTRLRGGKWPCLLKKKNDKKIHSIVWRKIIWIEIQCFALPTKTAYTHYPVVLNAHAIDPHRWTIPRYISDEKILVMYFTSISSLIVGS